MLNREPMSVLLWQHDPVNRLATLALLDGCGLAVVHPATESEALQRAADTDFVAVVLDARTSGAIAAMQTARRLRTQARSSVVPLLFLANGDGPGEADLLMVGLADVIHEPFDTVSLRARLRVYGALRQARADAACTAEAQHLALAVEAGSLGLWTWDIVHDRVTWDNELPYEMFGLPREATPVNSARFFAEFIHPDDVEPLHRALTRAFEGDGHYDFEGRMHRGGELRWLKLNGRVIRNAIGGPERMLGTVVDVTERKREEARIRHDEEVYRTLFDLLDEGACLIEVLFDDHDRPVDYLFIDTNAAFTQHTGLVGARGRRMRELVPDHDAHWFEIYGHIARTGEPRRWQAESKTLNRWFDLYASRIGGPGSRQVAVVFTDITAKKASEDRLRRTASELTEADQRKTEFLATLAHELRNPLAPLRNALELLRRAGDQPDIAGRALAIMERQLVQMVHLIDDLLDVARISSGRIDLKKQLVDLKTVVATAVETSLPLIEASHHRLSVRLPEEPLPLMADAPRLTQVVGNLLNNAAKYTPPGGRIELMALRDNEHVVMTVSDSGLGIPKESLCTVFEMFNQCDRNRSNAQGGLGVGLTLVRRLVERHGGTVSVASDGVGQGSLFMVRLPLANGAPPRAPSLPVGSETASTGGHGMRILVADDNPDAAEALATLIATDGHTVRIAHDGDAALALADEFRPDIAFLDIGMPGKNGYEVAHLLRNRPEMAELTLVALTGWGSTDDVARATAAGFDEHIVKPAGLDAVLDVVSRHARSIES